MGAGLYRFVLGRIDVIRSLLCLALLAVTPALTLAQQAKPALVISLASPDKLLSDMGFLAKAADAEQFVGVAQLLAQQYLQLMDTKQPAGILIDVDGGAPAGLAFLPVNNYPRMKEMITAQFARPQEQGGGIDKMDLGQPVFMKSQGSYVFVSTAINKLQNLPAEPVKLLDGMQSNYAIGVRLNVQSIPVELRRTAVSEMRQGFERELAGRSSDDPGNEVAEKVGRNMMEQITAAVNETSTLTAGWGVDPDKGHTYVDVAVTAMPNTNMAKKMSLLSKATTTFAGLNFPGAAARLNVATVMGPDQIQHNMDLLQSFESTMMKELEGQENETKQRAKAIFQDLVDVLKATAKTGRTDAGGVLLLNDTDPRLQLAIGMAVADGNKLDRAFRKALELAKDEGELPEVQLNAATHKGVNFHKLTISGLDRDAQKVFGEAISIAVGFGAESVYVGLGGEPIDLLKQAIDKSSRPVAAAPTTLTLSLTPIIRFAKSVDDAPAADAILEALGASGGRDHITIVSQVIPNGVQYRLAVEDGVIRAIAKSATRK